MKKLLIFLGLLLITPPFYGQDTINRTDSKGRKQGYWGKKSDDGKKIYEGHFRDNYPDGQFRYFYPDGKIKAVSNYSSHGRRVRTVTYFQNGKKMAEGNFVDEKKDSTWRFYSEFDGALTSEESYSAGSKDGISKTYYAGKGLAEIMTWKNGVREGPWEQYYSDGRIKLRGSFKNDQKDGKFMTLYSSGLPMIAGQYIDGNPEGTWLYYTEKGVIRKKEFFEDGKLMKVEEPQGGKK
jgi:antitoxin component YwqK of YwqJK toxin-antitoxin module